MSNLTEFEPLIRLGFLVATLALMISWEILAPRRPLTVSKPYSWINNGAIVLAGIVVNNAILLINRFRLMVHYVDWLRCACFNIVGPIARKSLDGLASSGSGFACQRLSLSELVSPAPVPAGSGRLCSTG